MIYYRPEWTCGRYNCNHNVAIMYNLIEGTSFLFEEVSAFFIGEIISYKRNTAIDTEDLSRCVKLEESIVNEFCENLCEEGLLSKHIFSDEDISQYRKHVVLNNKESEVGQSVSNEGILSDAEFAYTEIVKNDNLCHAVIELTYNCSANCIHCYNPKKMNMSGDELDLKDYVRIIDELYDLGCYKITLTGGDPFSKPSIWDIIQYIYDKGIALDVFTNGIIIESDIKRLINYYPKSVSVSLYSGLAEDHEAITRIRGSYQKTISSIEQLSSYGVPLIIKCCIMKPNVLSYDMVAHIAKRYSAMVQFEVSIMNSLDGGKIIGADLSLSEVMMEIVLRDSRIPLYVGSENGYGEKIRSENDRPCNAGESGICITPNGNVQFCVAFPCVLGNVRNDMILYILKQSEELKKWKGTTLKDFEKCNKYEFCNYCVICAGCNFVATGTPIQPSLNNCNLAKIRWSLAGKLKQGNDPLLGKSVVERLSEL